MYRIIVPLDGSELAEEALGLGQMLARSLKAPLELVQVLEEPVVLGVVASPFMTDLPSVKAYLQRVAASIPADLTVSAVVLRGAAVDELLAHTATTPDAIVVMSTHGRSGIGRVVFGSVADRVMRGAKVPVVLVRSSSRMSSYGLRNVLVPLDGSDLAEAMLPVAVSLARHTGAALHVVRVVEPFWTGTYGTFGPDAIYLSNDQVSDLEAEANVEAREYLDSIATRLRKDDLRVVWEVRVGKPAEEIVRAAQTTDADLVLMSSHGRGGIRRWAFGSVADEVLHHGDAPVLVLPPDARTGKPELMTETRDNLVVAAG